VRNDERVAKIPFDQKYNGFLPSNPVWGKNGTAYKKK
jgi:hypothetical protein